ncbi:hypothetical protein JHK87_024814 [Glycine soja]|nr:hypothetical protein JHK87_024814 [Glycine soja]
MFRNPTNILHFHSPVYRGYPHVLLEEPDLTWLHHYTVIPFNHNREFNTKLFLTMLCCIFNSSANEILVGLPDDTLERCNESTKNV